MGTGFLRRTKEMTEAQFDILGIMLLIVLIPLYFLLPYAICLIWNMWTAHKESKEAKETQPK